MESSKEGEYEKALPEPTEISKPFWDHCRAHELVMQFCPKCSNWIWYPRSICPQCGNLQDEIEWKELSGDGVIYSFTIIRQVIDNSPAFQKELPFAIALIELNEGPRIYSNVKGIDLNIGDRVEIYFEDVTPKISLPKFRKKA